MVKKHSSKKSLSSSDAFLNLVDAFEIKYREKGKSPSIIVVLGSAASYWSGMPSWNEMKEPILEEIEKWYQPKDHFIEEAWRKLSAITGIKNPNWSPEQSRAQLMRPATIELICSVAYQSDFVGEKIRLLLQEKFAFKKGPHKAGAPPQLGYELLSHFLKHHYIDHIITFNFDEVIDTCLDNELGLGEYNRIITDQQLLPTNSVDKPCLIKLHGSISSPQSLRFTRDHTRVLSQDMIRLIDDVIFYQRNTEKKAMIPKKIHLVSLGYSWSDIDFANWVKSRGDYISEMTIIRLEDSIPELISDIKDQIPVKLISVKNLLSSPPNLISIDQFLWSLCNELQKRFDGKIPYIPVSRHLILGYLFGPVKSERQEPVIEKFLNNHTPELRLQTEIYLHLIKCKGMVNASVMATDPRISRYYEMVYSQENREGNAADTFKNLKPSQFADIKETYFSTAATDNQLFEQFIQEDFVKSRADVPVYDPKTKKIKLIRKLHEEFIKEHARRIFEAPEVEITPNRERSTDWLFIKSKPLSTYLDLQEETRNLLETDWINLIVIAETGAWLIQPEILELLAQKKKRRREIFLLRTSMEATDEWLLKNKILAGIRNDLDEIKHMGIKQGELSWWEHNRHLTLAIGDQKANSVFLKGVYFRRRLKSSRISPVSVSNQQDCLELFFTFLSYVRRSCWEKPSDPDRNSFRKEVLALGENIFHRLDHKTFNKELFDRFERLLNGLREKQN